MSLWGSGGQAESSLEKRPGSLYGVRAGQSGNWWMAVCIRSEGSQAVASGMRMPMETSGAKGKIIIAFVSR